MPRSALVFEGTSPGFRVRRFMGPIRAYVYTRDDNRSMSRAPSPAQLLWPELPGDVYDLRALRSRAAPLQ